jgi:hypothetical protein
MIPTPNVSTTCPVVHIGGTVDRDIALFTSAGVNADVAIALHSPGTPDDETVSIMFGKEQITLEFYDVQSLERLRDLAHEGAHRLRTVIEANTSSHAATDRIRGDTAGNGSD